MLYPSLISFYRWCRNQKRRLWDPWTRWPPIGAIDFGDLSRLKPFDKNFGYGRGLPVDRYYIEIFLTQHRLDIAGRVLEIAEPLYTRKFGDDRVTRSDVLDLYLRKPGVTIIADLTDAHQIPSDTFDCIILTQTLQLIFEVKAAIQTCHRILKPRGILLATFPSISQVTRPNFLENCKDYWRFTDKAAQRICGEVFPPEQILVQTYGNVMAVTAFLYGLAAGELSPETLDFHDPEYQVTIGVKAVKL